MEWIACLASSWDGKITAPLPVKLTQTNGSSISGVETWVKLGSQADLTHLFTLRDTCEAILMGASTLRAFPKIRYGLNKPTPPVPVVLTQSWKLPWQALFFMEWQAQWGGIYVVSTQPPPAAAKPFVSPLLEQGRLQWLQPQADTPTAITTCIANALRPLGVTRLLVEGGGNIVSLCLQARVLSEFYLTLTPWLLGGGNETASLLGSLKNKGFALQQAPRLEHITVTQLGNELFLHAQVVYPQ